MSKRDPKEMPFILSFIAWIAIFVFGAGLVGVAEGAAVAWLFVIGPLVLWTWLMSRWPVRDRRDR
jgi:hypothetical protein